MEQRTIAGHPQPLWMFPGGKCRVSESPENGLVRELTEELGITVQRAELIKTVPYTTPTFEGILYGFWVDLYEKIPHSQEGQVLKWIHAASLETTQMPPSNLTFLAALQARRAEAFPKR